MHELEKWTSALVSDLGVQPQQLDHKRIVAMARDAGRAVTKPAGPISAYLVGVAVGNGLSPAEAAKRAAELTERWPTIDWSD